MFQSIKKNKHGMLISELCRLFTVKKLLIGILLTSGIAVFSVSDSISLESIYFSMEFKQSICDQLQLSLTFDRYKSLYVIATSLCTVTMVPSDIKNHVLPYIRQRSDTNEMIVSRLISVALYIIVVIIMGFLLAGILLTPFMSCTAKLPIYAFFINAFFKDRGGLIMSALYLGGIVVGILIAFLFKSTLFKGEAVPFVMELPNYRLPGMKNVARLLWEKAKDFLQRAFTVILIATMCVWFLQSFDLSFNMVENSKDSILAMIAGWIAPVFAPAGLGDWRIVTSFISGFMAKESVVSTLQILFTGGVEEAFSTVTAASILAFSLLYTPCIAAIASIRRELGRKWAAGVVIWQCVIAWLAAFMVHLIGMGLNGSHALQNIGIGNVIVVLIILAIVLFAVRSLSKKGTCQCSDGCNACGKKKR